MFESGLKCFFFFFYHKLMFVLPSLEDPHSHQSVTCLVEEEGDNVVQRLVVCLCPVMNSAL